MVGINHMKRKFRPLGVKIQSERLVDVCEYSTILHKEFVVGNIFFKETKGLLCMFPGYIGPSGLSGSIPDR